MPLLSVPFHATRQSLYSWKELQDGFDPLDKKSFRNVLDFRIYRHYALSGFGAADATTNIGESLHDGCILKAALDFLSKYQKVVAIMGGHDLPRNGAAYAQVVNLAQQLAKSEFLIASGGGPGAMEAAHLGALMKNSSDADVAAALAELSSAPNLPDTRNIIDLTTGAIDEKIEGQMHDWFAPAASIMAKLPSPEISLAVPTWQYGNEPFMPFATHVAKYFQNSIREDGLLALAAGGIVFARGKSGTLQEVFQDAAKNYNHSFNGKFAPMVFLDEDYWKKTLPVESTLAALFRANGRGKEYDERVLFTNSIDQAVSHIQKFFEPQKTLVTRWQAKFSLR